MRGKKRETSLACNVSSKDWWKKSERKLRMLCRVVHVVHRLHKGRHFLLTVSRAEAALHNTPTSERGKGMVSVAVQVVYPVMQQLLEIKLSFLQNHEHPFLSLV